MNEVWAVPVAPVSSIAVVGAEQRFPVRRIFCVGRNYAAHRREMGGDDRDPPFFFTKPADAVVASGSRIAYPQGTADLHHEVELVVALKSGGADIPVASAMEHVFGYGVGIDLTRRDLQALAREKGQPWDAAKAFDHSAPMSALVPGNQLTPQAAIRLTVNGNTRQQSDLSNMIWSVPEIIAQASQLWTLAAGDLIFTGTPEGVGPLVRGDCVRGEVEGIGVIEIDID